jgi:hypothetical protein
MQQISQPDFALIRSKYNLSKWFYVFFFIYINFIHIIYITHQNRKTKLSFFINYINYILKFHSKTQFSGLKLTWNFINQAIIIWITLFYFI